MAPAGCVPQGCFTTYLTGIPWSEDFMRQYAAALEGVKAQTTRDWRITHQTWDHQRTVRVRYYRSPDFRSLKPSTQVMRRNIIENFRNAHGDKPVKLLGRKHIKAYYRCQGDKPHAANNLLKVLRVLLGYAIDINMIDLNPAIGVKKYKATATASIAGARMRLRGSRNGIRWFAGAVGICVAALHCPAAW